MTESEIKILVEQADTCLWESPTPYPTDGELYTWDEDTTSWVVEA